MSGPELPEIPDHTGYTHATGRALLRGRAAAREMGRSAVIEALRASLRERDEPFIFVTSWARATATGSGGRLHEFESAGHYASWLRARSAEVYPKREGPTVAHGESRHGGSKDDQASFICAFALDNDGGGNADDLLEQFNAIGLEYAAQRKPDDHDHIIVMLARALVPPTPCEEWKAETYRPQLGWILGVLSELAQLECRAGTHGSGAQDVSHLGFDAATDRLLQQVFVYTRRAPDDPVPQTLSRNGAALDWDAFLAATGYTPEPKALTPRRVEAPHGTSSSHVSDRPSSDAPPRSHATASERTRVIHPPPPLDDARLQLIAEAVGAAAAKYADGRNALHRALAGVCLRGGVSTDKACSLGRSIAQHAGDTEKLRDRLKQWRSTVRRFERGHIVTGMPRLEAGWPDVAAVLETAMPREISYAEIVARELHARRFTRVDLATAEQELSDLLDSPAPCVRLVVADPGLGKSRRAAHAAVRRANGALGKRRIASEYKTLIVHPRQEVCRDTVRIIEEQNARVSHRLSVLQTDSGCDYPQAAERLMRAGLSFSAIACKGEGQGPNGSDSPCPKLKDCAGRTEVANAAGIGTSPPPVTVTVPQLVPSVIESFAADGHVVLDDIETMLDTPMETVESLTAAARATVFERHAPRFSKSAQFRTPVLEALATGLKLLSPDSVPSGCNVLLWVFHTGFTARAADAAWLDRVRELYGTENAGEVAVKFARKVAYAKADNASAAQWKRRGVWAPMTAGSVGAVSRNPEGMSEALVAAAKTHANIARAFASAVGADAVPEGASDHGQRVAASLDAPFRGEKSCRNTVLRLVILQDGAALALGVAPYVTVLNAGGSHELVSAVLRLARGDRAPRVERVTIHVNDAERIHRTLFYWSNATMKNCLTTESETDTRGVSWEQGVARYFSAAMEMIFDQLASVATPRIAVITWKTMRVCLEHAWRHPDAADADPGAVALLAPLRARGAALEFGHFGALHSNNDFNECDGYLVFGDPRPNAGAVHAIAGALGLLSDVSSLYKHMIRAELLQAVGRARACRRAKPAAIVVVGSEAPLDWDDRSEVRAMLPGPGEPLDPQFAQWALKTWGGASAAARETGWGRTTLIKAAARAVAVSPVPESSNGNVTGFDPVIAGRGGVKVDVQKEEEGGEADEQFLSGRLSHPPPRDNGLITPRESPKAIPPTDLQSLVHLYGSVRKTAHALGCSPALVTRWHKRAPTGELRIAPQWAAAIRRLLAAAAPAESMPGVVTAADEPSGSPEAHSASADPATTA